MTAKEKQGFSLYFLLAFGMAWLLQVYASLLLLRDGNAAAYQLLLAVSMFCPLVSVLLVALDNLDFVTTFTAVLATLNNIGPGLGLVGPTGNFFAFSPWAKLLLSFDMLAGRLELFPMLILLMPSTWRKY